MVPTTRDLSPTPARRRWLCIAYAFPPINRSGTLRTLAFVNHLSANGWDAAVLTVEPNGEALDGDLLSALPSTTRIERTKCRDPVAWLKSLIPRRRGRLDPGPHIPVSSLPSGSARPHATRAWLSQLLQTPDSRLGWVPSAVWKGLQLIRRHRPDLIYSTAPPQSAHLIALVLSRLARLPWVADFRDPWRENPFRDLNFPSLDRWDDCMERAVLRGASRIVLATPTMRTRLCRRRIFASAKCTTILNGFDANRLTHIEPIRTEPPGTLVLCHAGQFYGPRRPTTLFRALRRLQSGQSPTSVGRPVKTGDLCLQLIGPEHYEGRSLHTLAQDAGIASAVRLLGPMGHRAAVGHLAGADALLLIGQNGAGGDLQIPAKLFEYLALRKPILACVPASNPAVEILRECHAQAVVCSPGDEIGLADAMAGLSRRQWPAHPDAWTGVDRFDRIHRAAELADLFEQTVAEHRRERFTGETEGMRTQPSLTGVERGSLHRPSKPNPIAASDSSWSSSPTAIRTYG